MGRRPFLRLERGAHSTRQPLQPDQAQPLRRQVGVDRLTGDAVPGIRRVGRVEVQLTRLNKL